MALSDEQVDSLVEGMWEMHRNERPRLDRVHGYAKGSLGLPDVPEGSSDEVKQLAKLSPKNVIGLVIGSFAQNLSVVGYRPTNAREDSSAWGLWQAQRMDARQAEVHRPALTYGAAYVVVTPGEDGRPVFRPRSPRQLIAVYEDPQVDAWPAYALETWMDTAEGKVVRRGVLMDDENMYPVNLGEVPKAAGEKSQRATEAARGVRVEERGEPVPHGARADGRPVCPVVRFVNDRDAEDVIVGEVEPLIVLQQAINSVNFDRLIVSRFGAHPQKVISGWTAGPAEVLRASASRVWTFDDAEVKASALPAGSVEPYNSLLAEMMEHVAMVAQISPAQVTGKMVNLSADALAAGEANQQRKLVAKRESFGESWEQVLRLGAEMAGDDVSEDDTDAEVVWRDTEARSFGAVVDGVTKLAQAGVPIGLILSMVPGLSQQQIQAIREEIRTGERQRRVLEMSANLGSTARAAAMDNNVTAAVGTGGPGTG